MPNIGLFQRPGPAKIRPSKFASVPEQPRPAQTAAPAAEPTAGQLAHAKAIFGNPKSNKNGFDETVRNAVKPSLVLYHDCQQKLDGHGERCSCKSRIPHADAERKIAEGTHKWLTTTKADGTLYVSSKSIVSLTPRLNPKFASILVHGCLDTPCYCSTHINPAAASKLVEEGRATWLEVTRNGVTYALHTSIILTADEVARRDTAIRKLLRPRGRPVEKFKLMLQDSVEAGRIAQAEADLTDTQIWDGFKDPEKFSVEHPALFPKGFERPSYLSPFSTNPSYKNNVLRRNSIFITELLYCTSWYWDRLLTGDDLDKPIGDLNDETRGVPMVGDDQKPYGQMVTGGVIDEIARVKDSGE
jgi:hypothetical protein